MDETEFAERLADTITQFIQCRFEHEGKFFDNPYHGDKKSERIALLKEYAKHKRYSHGIQQILENDLFQYEPEDLEDCYVRKEVALELYNNIVAVYEELKALATEDNDDPEARKRCCY